VSNIKPVLAACSILALQPIPALAQTPLALQGGWSTPGATAVVQLAPCEKNPARLCGVLASVSNPRAVRPGLVGQVVMENLAWKDGVWRGRMTDLATGEVRRGTIRLTQTAQRNQCSRPACGDKVWRRID
jgi:hypothetical protein